MWSCLSCSAAARNAGERRLPSFARPTPARPATMETQGRRGAYLADEAGGMAMTGSDGYEVVMITGASAGAGRAAVQRRDTERQVAGCLPRGHPSPMRRRVA